MAGTTSPSFISHHLGGGSLRGTGHYPCGAQTFVETTVPVAGPLPRGAVKNTDRALGFMALGMLCRCCVSGHGEESVGVEALCLVEYTCAVFFI